MLFKLSLKWNFVKEVKQVLHCFYSLSNERLRRNEEEKSHFELNETKT